MKRGFQFDPFTALVVVAIIASAFAIGTLTTWLVQRLEMMLSLVFILFLVPQLLTGLVLSVFAIRWRHSRKGIVRRMAATGAAVAAFYTVAEAIAFGGWGGGPLVVLAALVIESALGAFFGAILGSFIESGKSGNESGQSP